MNPPAEILINSNIPVFKIKPHPPFPPMGMGFFMLLIVGCRWTLTITKYRIPVSETLHSTKENVMQCELCSHEVDESNAEVITLTYETELQDGTKTKVTDHYWACPDCVWLEEMNQKK